MKKIPLHFRWYWHLAGPACVLAGVLMGLGAAFLLFVGDL